MKNFKKLMIWQKGMEIVVKSYEVTKYFPKEERFGITRQINRASLSVPSNIAEGSSRDSQKEYKHFLRIALGSCFELETQLLVAERLQLMKVDEIEELKTLIDEEQKMLMSFIRKL